jgi:hypothetical protein
MQIHEHPSLSSSSRIRTVSLPCQQHGCRKSHSIMRLVHFTLLFPSFILPVGWPVGMQKRKQFPHPALNPSNKRAIRPCIYSSFLLGRAFPCCIIKNKTNPSELGAIMSTLCCVATPSKVIAG